MSQRSALDEVNLEKFVPWLQQFHWLLGNESIELPGQYSGESRPNIRTNIKIIRFEAKVKVFRTLRRPIKLSILCSDGHTYDFLVKYGEDLRQDQCVQQMQRLITNQLATDKNCRPHNLSIETFNVIPINTMCGMLSWVNDTQSMQQMLGDFTRGPLIQKYVQFLRKAPTSQNDHSLYGEAVAFYTPQAVSDQASPISMNSRHHFRSSFQIADNFTSIASLVPKDILRDALYAMSSSPECFFMLRNNFASSLATMAIGNWIMGIGDRHLNNLLISKKTGKIIGIDFGYAYGMATRGLMIPELIPMRLTPQFVNVISPMETSGLIKKCMVYTLRAVRDVRQTIMAAMEAVVIDSSADETDGQSNNDNQQGRQRIFVLNRKLLGANPLHLTVNDVKDGRIAR